ncbi:MAG TPA: LuxR C-terminal-related transcriptional regulator [Burkholderiaceae bacterium]|nr:LuxR C-terminal-related transcriptional regulator [Burkholderiaceae bacterium]
MRARDFLDVSQASDLKMFERRLISFAYGMEFPLVNAFMVVERPALKPVLMQVGNTPQAYMDVLQNVTGGARDPVLRRLRSQSIPFLYDQRTYVDARAGDLWEEQARFGYATGVAVALHLPDHSHFVIGMDRDQSLPDDDAHMTRLLADLQLLAVHAQHAASRLMKPAPADPDGPLPRLTRRQTEVLRHAMEGKSAWTIGEVLGLSEHTINFHMNAAMERLGCSTRIQAILRATELGLL